MFRKIYINKLTHGSHTDRKSDICEMENLTSKVHSLLIEASQSHRHRQTYTSYIKGSLSKMIKCD